MEIGLHFIANVVQSDHHRLEDLHRDLVRSADPSERRDLQARLVRDLARHMHAEEAVVFPVLAKTVRQGRRVVERGRVNHREMRRHLADFRALSPADDGFSPALDGLIDLLGKHFNSEERRYLVQLEKAIDENTSGALAREFKRVKELDLDLDGAPLGAREEGSVEAGVKNVLRPLDFLKGRA